MKKYKLSYITGTDVAGIYKFNIDVPHIFLCLENLLNITVIQTGDPYAVISPVGLSGIVYPSIVSLLSATYVDLSILVNQPKIYQSPVVSGQDIIIYFEVLEN